MLAAALWYAKHKTPVFPLYGIDIRGHCDCGKPDCGSPGKHPHTAQGFKDASSDEATIAQWWKQWPNANIGMPTGVQAGVMVIDVDPRHGGDRSLLALCQEHDFLPDTREVTTGGGGAHYFFKCPNPAPKNGANVLGPGLDIRSEGGYVVVPPSAHASGRRYAWVERDQEVSTARAPEWLLELLQHPHTGEHTNGIAGRLDVPSVLQGVPEGQRDETIFRLAGKLRYYDTPQDIAEELVLKAAANCSPPFPPDLARAKVAAVYNRYAPTILDAPLASVRDEHPYAADDEGEITRRVDIDVAHYAVFRARAIHQERTGVHANLSIEVDGVVLGWSVFNVERDEDRVRLGNSAHKQIASSQLGSLYPALLLKKDLDRFCRNLWDEHVGQLVPEDMPGDEDMSPPNFLLYPYLIEGGGTILFAPPGRGKSFTGMLMAVSVDAGCQKLWKVQQAPVLFINLERSALLVRRRLARINRALGLPMDRTLFTINARGKSLTDVAASCRRAIVTRGIKLIILDSLSRAGAGDLTENVSVNRIVDVCNGLAPTWMALGHTSRADESHVYGGIHFDAGADLCVQLSTSKTDAETGIGLEITKDNDVGSQPMQFLAYTFDEGGFVGARLAGQEDFPDLTSGRKQTMKEIVREYLLDKGKSSASVLAKALGFNRANISTLLAQDAEFVVVEQSGREVRYGVVRHHEGG